LVLLLKLQSPVPDISFGNSGMTIDGAHFCRVDDDIFGVKPGGDVDGL
jgi:hypothetical protein